MKAMAVAAGTMIVGVTLDGRACELILLDGEWCHAGTGDLAGDLQLAEGWRVVSGRVVAR